MYLKKTIREMQPAHTESIVGNPFIDRLLQNRGVTSRSSIDYSINKLLSPWGLKDINEAVDTIIKHIFLGSNILIVGDYDCDGATATTIAYEGLKMCGAKNVDFIVPDRQKHGYGLTPAIVNDLAYLKPDLIITVDNGVSSFDGAKSVSELGCELLITDHHLAPSVGLPIASAIVNPNRNDCSFESKNIAGCGVIFYVIMALRAKMRDEKLFDKLGIQNPNIKSLMDVLALGTVADLVTLDENNRNIVSIGLDIIRSGGARPGIMALIKVSGKDHALLTATDFGFGLGPRINAAGRMSDMKIGINCLLAKSDEEANKYAMQLNQLNVDRKETQKKMMVDAEVATDDIQADSDGITVYQEGWHEGVIGILASQVKEKLNRPIICFTDTEPEDGEEIIKGSARSVDGVHLKHVLDEIFVNHPTVLKKFGGHAMAAGVSLPKSKYLEFSKLFNDYVTKHITQDIRDGVFYADFEDVPARALTLRNAKEIEALGPWGQKFTLPIFSGDFFVKSWKIVAEKHLKLVLEKDNAQFEGIAFNCIEEGSQYNPYTGKVKLIFKLDINRFRGNESLQLMIDYIEVLDVTVTENANNHRQLTKDGAGRKGRNLDEACKLFC
jgi:single-stranded-DNA-specific exonuclease